jgi:hypothetical protein
MLLLEQELGPRQDRSQNFVPRRTRYEALCYVRIRGLGGSWTSVLKCGRLTSIHDSIQTSAFLCTSRMAIWFNFLHSNLQHYV